MKEVEIPVTGGWLCKFGAGERAGLEIGIGCGAINMEGQWDPAAAWERARVLQCEQELILTR